MKTTKETTFFSLSRSHRANGRSDRAVVCHVRSAICWRCLVDARFGVHVSHEVSSQAVLSKSRRSRLPGHFSGCGYGAGFMVNYNDIAGSFAGLVFGMSNTPGTVSGIIAPSFVGVLTQNVSVLHSFNAISLCKHDKCLLSKAIAIGMATCVHNHSCSLPGRRNRLSAFGQR